MSGIGEGRPAASPHGPPDRPGLLHQILHALKMAAPGCQKVTLAVQVCQISALIDESREQCQEAALEEETLRPGSVRTKRHAGHRKQRSGIRCWRTLR